MYIKPYKLRDNVMTILVTNLSVDGSLKPVKIIHVQEECWLYEFSDIFEYSGKMVTMGAIKPSSKPPFICYYEESISLTKTAINSVLKERYGDFAIRLGKGDIILIHDKIPKINFKKCSEKKIKDIISKDKKHKTGVTCGRKTIVVRKKNNTD